MAPIRCMSQSPSSIDRLSATPPVPHNHAEAISNDRPVGARLLIESPVGASNSCADLDSVIGRQVIVEFQVDIGAKPDLQPPS